MQGIEENEVVLTTDGYVKAKNLTYEHMLYSNTGIECGISKLRELSCNCRKLTFSDMSELTISDEQQLVTGCFLRYSGFAVHYTNAKGIYNDVNSKMRLCHHVENCQPIIYDEQDCIIDAYTAGAFLIAGNSKTGLIESHNMNELYKINKAYTLQNMLILAKTAQILTKSYIPYQYMHNTINVRQELLKGIFDTCGKIRQPRSAQLYMQNETIAEQTYEMLVSLGNVVEYTKQTRKDKKYIVLTVKKHTFELFTRPEQARLLHKKKNTDFGRMVIMAADEGVKNIVEITTTSKQLLVGKQNIAIVSEVE